MKKISITMFTVLASATIAFAQGAAKDTKAGAGVGAAAGVGAKVDAKAAAGAAAGATGQAAGGAKAAGGAAAGAAGQAASGAKAAGGAAAGAAGGAAAGAAGGAKVDAKATVTADAKMEMPKPPAEIGAMAKSMGGTWRCQGSGVGPDMKTELKFKATMNAKADLDGWWVRHVMNGTMGEGKAAMKFKMESFATFDGNAKKWRTVGVMNDGGSMVGTSDGMKDGKMTTSSDTWGPWGQGQFRDHMDAADMKAGVKFWGEMSMDKGKSWNKVYEMTCKK